MKDTWRNCPTCGVEVTAKYYILGGGIYQCLKCKEIFGEEELKKAFEERIK